MNAAELLVPALRWDSAHGYDRQRALIDRGIELGVGGFILFGGNAEGARALTRELHDRSKIPLLVGADLERGAGQQFEGATGLPPLAALGAMNDPDAMRRAAGVTAREARELGINWVFGPVLDLDVEPRNPIIGTRAIGRDPEMVARLGSEWISACQENHVLACAKHFPGHGRTTTDSHAELPVVNASAEVLEAEDLVPFKLAVVSGVASVMTAHVAFPALDSEGGPATLSRRILSRLLRERLVYDQLIVTDALIMAGVRGVQSEAQASVAAIAAGCDLLLYPEDIDGVLAALDEALDSGELETSEVRKSLERRQEWAAWAAAPPAGASLEGAAEWAAALSCRAVTMVQGTPAPVAGALNLTIVDDDLGGPYPPPSREPFAERLRELGVNVSRADAAVGAEPGTPHVIALFGDVRAWKGRPGYSRAAVEAVHSALAAAGGAAAPVVIVQFGHPRLGREIGTEAAMASAWGGERVMQRAAAEWLVNRCSALQSQ